MLKKIQPIQTSILQFFSQSNYLFACTAHMSRICQVRAIQGMFSCLSAEFGLCLEKFRNDQMNQIIKSMLFQIYIIYA